jgi:predicted glycosyltransferase
MRVFLSVEHPAWAHQFRRLVEKLLARGDQIKIVAIDKDGAAGLLTSFGLPFTLLGRSTGRNNLEKAWLLISLSFRYLWHAWRFQPDILVGRATPMMAVTAFFLRRQHIVFEDTDHSYISLFFCKLFSSKIITPQSFRGDLGPKHVRQPLYKESFYLHPEVFTPDPSVLEMVGVSKDEPFVVIRFVSWLADHDRGCTGLSHEVRRRVVSELSKYARVFISSERPLGPDLAAYELRLPRAMIHSLVYYASLVYGESSTMASEAALLGTHAIFCDFEGRGYTDEQEAAYGLVYNFKLDPASQDASVAKAIELIRMPDLKALGKAKGRKLISETVNGTDYMFGMLADYEKSKRCAA